ncbi:Xg blood group, partial [Chelydra serpentina]
MIIQNLTHVLLTSRSREAIAMTDSFSDLDLNDGKPLPPRPAGEKESNVNHGGNTDSGVVAGVTSPVISVLVLLVVGTVAGYTAYKKKQLCFKANSDENKRNFHLCVVL